MEWYESLFQQVCAYLLVHVRTAHQRRTDAMPTTFEKGIKELIQAYGHSEIGAVFKISDVMPALNAGKELVLLAYVRETVFHRTAQELLRERCGSDVRQILAASFENVSPHPSAAGHQFDVVVCR